MIYSYWKYNHLRKKKEARVEVIGSIIAGIIIAISLPLIIIILNA